MKWAAVFLLLLAPLPAHAGALTTLVDFAGSDGGHPTDSLVLDANGALFGSTAWGGPEGKGTVFKLTPPVAGQSAWLLTTLVGFGRQSGVYSSGGPSGGPSGGLIPDTKGNLYGTTLIGGAHRYGTVFRISPPTGTKAAWSLTTLYDNGWAHGVSLSGPLALDANGALVGAIASIGAPAFVSSVFRLAPTTDGKPPWIATTLIQFTGAAAANPNGGLVRDHKGNLYGTTMLGGPDGVGTAFRLNPPSAGKGPWTMSRLAAFHGADGATPNGGLMADGKGGFYGTTVEGGDNDNGTVFRLSPPTHGQTDWTLTTLHRFAGKDGCQPNAGLLVDAGGALRGTTNRGGKHGAGTVFRLSPPGDGKNAWALATLASFGDAVGAYPTGGLVADTQGNLYGTTFRGGKHDLGTVFAVRP